MEKQEAGTQLVIKGMSNKEEKLIDILKDISIKCDEIKSDTELIKEQIELILDNQTDLEAFLKSQLGSDWEKLKFHYEKYKAGNINRKQLIGQGIKIIGKKFVVKIIFF